MYYKYVKLIIILIFPKKKEKASNGKPVFTNLLYADVEMGRFMGYELRIKFSRGDFAGFWFNIMGNNIPSHKKKHVRALLLHSPSLHSLYPFLLPP